MKTEDEVRTQAEKILGFNQVEKDVKQGVGQITSFNQLGFKGVLDKPDGWYLPHASRPAIVAEFKDEKFDLDNQKFVDELIKNIRIVEKRYSNTIGILYNGRQTRVFINGEETLQVSKKLEHKDYYIKLVNDLKIDKNEIYRITQKINNNLHFNFGLTDLQDRMIFTACALVASRYNDKILPKMKDAGYDLFHNAIIQTVTENINKDDNQTNQKLNILVEEYSSIKMAITENQEAINSFIDDVSQISHLVNSRHWRGEDVMGIFFNEFSRYKGKSDAGQVFTPDHITSFMYRLIEVNQDDKVLDAACGSGAFLTKAMSEMIRQAGGHNTEKAKKIKQNQLFGIELYRKIYALACANMLIHKDGKTNLQQMDARSQDAFFWIKSQGVTKVLMNPPYERKYGCMKIVENVLNAVPAGTKSAFILPDKKLEKDGGKKLLKNHRLHTIIKMPEKLFNEGITTSVFVFEAGIPQENKNIIGYYMEDDGLETVKNQGRHDVKGKWQDIENYWIEAIRDGHEPQHNTRQIINPQEHLSYQMPEKPFEIFEEDFLKTMMDYELFKRGIDVKQFNADVLEATLYGAEEK